MDTVNFDFDTYLSDKYHLVIKYMGIGDIPDYKSIHHSLYYCFDEYDDFSLKKTVKVIRDLFYGTKESLLYITVVDRDNPDIYSLVRYEDGKLLNYSNHDDNKYVHYSLNDRFDCNFSASDVEISYFYEIADLMSIKGTNHALNNICKKRKTYRRYC